MTVEELEVRMSARELAEWGELSRLDAEKEAVAGALAEAGAGRGSGRRRAARRG